LPLPLWAWAAKRTKAGGRGRCGELLAAWVPLAPLPPPPSHKGRGRSARAILQKIANRLAIALRRRQMIRQRASGNAVMVTPIERRGQADVRGAGRLPELGLLAP